MPPIEALTEQSLREYGLLGTVVVLSLIFGIVFYWRRPPAPQHASPMQAVEDKSKLIPLILEETRANGRHLREISDHLEDVQVRLERMQTLGEIIKDRQMR